MAVSGVSRDLAVSATTKKNGKKRSGHAKLPLHKILLYLEPWHHVMDIGNDWSMRNAGC